MQPRSEPASSNNSAQPNISDQQITPPSKQNEPSQLKKRTRHPLQYGANYKRPRIATPTAIQSIPALLTSPAKNTPSHTSTTPSNTSPQQIAEASSSSTDQSPDKYAKAEIALLRLRIKSMVTTMEKQETRIGKLQEQVDQLLEQATAQTKLNKELIKRLNSPQDSSAQIPQSPRFLQSFPNGPIPPTPGQFHHQPAQSHHMPFFMLPPTAGHFFHPAPQAQLPSTPPPFVPNFGINYRPY